jgi:hypothetical protein
MHLLFVPGETSLRISPSRLDFLAAKTRQSEESDAFFRTVG